jgi:hypothetical protein
MIDWDVIDRILSPSKEDERLSRQRVGLIAALERFGYHDKSSEWVPYNWEQGFEAIDLVYPCERVKPYRIWESPKEHGLIIIHDFCKGNYAHEVQFLKDMIPVIGRLDARAELYEQVGWGPRLIIKL